MAVLSLSNTGSCSNFQSSQVQTGRLLLHARSPQMADTYLCQEINVQSLPALYHARVGHILPCISKQIAARCLAITL